MTMLATAKSRATARTETLVSYKAYESNPLWDGMSVTIAGGDANGANWGHVGQPARYRFTTKAISGGASEVVLSGNSATEFNTWAGGVMAGGTVRVYRAANGRIELIRSAIVTSEQVDYWARLGGSNVITGGFFEHKLDSFSARKIYTYGVSRVDAAGKIGPVSTVTVDATSSTYTVVDPTPATTGSSVAAITGRNASLAAVTGLTAQIRSGTTHNVQLNWDSGGDFVVLLNWDGSADRLPEECKLFFDSGSPVLAGDMLVFESTPILSIQHEWQSARVRDLVLVGPYGPESLVFGYNTNKPGGRTWEYVPYGVAQPKPDITYPDYFLRVNGTPSLPARIERFIHAGTDQDFYDTLVPGRVYRVEIVAAAESPIDASFVIQQATLASPAVVSLTTEPQTFTFDFTVSSILKPSTPFSWRLTAAANNSSVDILSVRAWDASAGFQELVESLPEGIDVRDHNLIKGRPSPSLDEITSRAGFGPEGWSLASLLQVCRDQNCNPHFQIEWFYEEQFYLDLVTFLYAPVESGEPLALKREALGFGPVNVEFPSHLYEDGNERWNGIMWSMFSEATDSVTGEVYSQGKLSAMFASRRRAIMESSTYWPAANPMREFAGGWLVSSGYTRDAVDPIIFSQAESTSVAMYTSGTDVNQVLLADNKERWLDILTISEVSIRSNLENLIAALPETAPKIAVYEAGPGYQLNGLNGASVTIQNKVDQEVMAKSVGGTTALMASIGISSQLGVGPYNFFTWGRGPLWKAARRPHEGGGFYRVADFLRQTQEMLGRSRVFSTSDFIARTQDQPRLNTSGEVVSIEKIGSASVYHFESLDHPGRHGILYCNRRINLDAFGAGHPDYVAGETGSASFRYHTGLPLSATPWKVLRNEGNFRQHDAYQVGKRLNVVGSAIDGYVADPLCVDLTVTPEDFTVSDPTLRELTLLGGNCRLEIFET